jgi:hypothetical protein
MAYSGTTAASSVANPPNLVASALTGRLTASSSATVGGGGQVWQYSSTNLTTDMTAANFFAEAYYIGMKQGDIVMGAQASSAGSTTQIAYVGVLGAVSTAGAALSTGGTMTSTFN